MTDTEDTVNTFYMNSREHSKTINQLQSFIAAVEKGSRAAMFGPGYVVMSNKVYKDLLDKIPANLRIRCLETPTPDHYNP